MSGWSGSSHSTFFRKESSDAEPKAPSPADIERGQARSRIDLLTLQRDIDALTLDGWDSN